MFLDSWARQFARFAIIGAAVAMPVAAAAGVVVKSSGPSSDTYTVGTKLEDGSRVTLKAGDTITVLTSQGTQVMRGAGTFRVGEKPKKSRLRFANFTRKGAAGRVRTGAVRTGDNGPASRPNLWYVDLSQSGTTCLYDFETVRLWRPEAGSSATYTVVEPEQADAVEVHFEAKENERVLNSERLSLAEGRTYAVRGPDSEIPTSVSFALIGEYERPDELAEMLIAKGCTDQLALMADRLEADAE
jgi:hypothetical protein